MGRGWNRQRRMSALSWVIFRSKTQFFHYFFEVNFLDDFLMDFYRFWMDFGRVLGGQNGRQIKNLADFLSMLLETSFLVEISGIFHKNDGEKHMEFSLFLNMLFHNLFAEFAVFCNARNLQNSDFP